MPSSPVSDDPDDLAAARRGDLDAYSRLVEGHYPRLLGQARAFSRDPQLAQDLVQECLVLGWKSIARFEGRARLGTWLHGILLNCARSAWRRQSRRIAPPPAEPEVRPEVAAAGADPAEQLVESEVARDLRALVLDLPPAHREVVMLRFYGDARLAEIAETLGISLGTVKSRLFHAMEKLRNHPECMNLLSPTGHPPA